MLKSKTTPHNITNIRLLTVSDLITGYFLSIKLEIFWIIAMIMISKVWLNT